MLARFLPDRFMMLLIGTVALATLLPAKGAFASAVDAAATAAVVLLFFLHGARLPREAVAAGLTHWRLHLAILACTFLLFPLLGIGMAALLPGLLPPLLWSGMIFLCLLPSTVQSSVAFTAIAGGNVPAAVAAASASQLAGIFLTPLLSGMLLHAGGGGGGSIQGIGGILLQLFLPFATGHLLRPWIGARVERHKKWTSITDRSTILLAVYSAFSAAVIEGIWSRLPPLMLAILLAACLVILGLVLTATTLIGRAMGLPRGDRIALIFAGSKKSLVAGIPMARVMFAGPDMGVLLLPAMIFHQVQLMACAWLAKRWGSQSRPE